ncbi:MAG: hypothetical protein PHQ05_00230 [Sterolibacterium sp.]|nr:hypothetical protein [Sterolibacterium sp.]
MLGLLSVIDLAIIIKRSWAVFSVLARWFASCSRLSACLLVQAEAVPIIASIRQVAIAKGLAENQSKVLRKIGLRRLIC